MRTIFYICIAVICFIILGSRKTLIAQNSNVGVVFDTLRLTQDSMVVFRDSIWIPIGDTLLLIEKDTKYKIKKNRFKTSESFYDSIYYKTRKKKFTREIYNLALSHKPYEDELTSGTHEIAKNPFEAFQGKKIRSIRFLKVDILDGSVEDTLKKVTSGIGKIMNSTHINTNTWILKKFLIIKEGDQVIPAIIADNERIIRDIPAIEDVKFVLKADSIASEYVDLIVITKDIFPIGVTASASSLDNFSARLWTNNAMGFAYELGGKLIYDDNFSNPWGYELFTKYRNMFGSFVDISAFWLDAYNSRRLTFNLSKDFISPQIKYGGGLQFGWIKDQYVLSSSDTLVTGTYNTQYQDLWLGRSFLLGDKSSRKNLIISARYEHKHFSERPFIAPDSNLSFQKRDIYYAKLGYSKINYYKTNMIKSYGISENIPFGLNMGLTFAYLDSDFFKRTYLGYNLGFGKYYEKLGYLSTNIILGGFYDIGSLTQGIIETNLLYYTPLININRYKTRSFFSLNFRTLIAADDKTQINFEDYLRNLDQSDLGGISTLVTNFEFVLFSPWFLYGFRFAPYVFADVGLLSSNQNIFYKTRMYTVIGAGIRIRNESLAFKSIILSFGYFTNTISENKNYFIDYRMGENNLVPLLSNDRPYILRRNIVLPF